MFKFKNGQTAKDCVTGFKGIIVSRCDYVTGCAQYLLQPKAVNNTQQDGKWLDENRLSLCKKKQIILEEGSIKGGFKTNAPNKHLQ